MLSALLWTFSVSYVCLDKTQDISHWAEISWFSQQTTYAALPLLVYWSGFPCAFMRVFSPVLSYSVWILQISQLHFQSFMVPFLNVFFSLAFWDRISFRPLWPWTHYVAKHYLELLILLSPSSLSAGVITYDHLLSYFLPLTFHITILLHFNNCSFYFVLLCALRRWGLNTC